MVIMDCYTECGDGKKNEDVYGYKNNVMWVIDGATDLFGTNFFGSDDDVAYYVECLGKSIEECCEDNVKLSAILKEAIRITNIKVKMIIEKYEAYTLPSFAICMVRLLEDVCEYYVLGDCTALIRTNGGQIEITDKRIQSFTTRNREGIQKLREKGLLDSDSEISLYKETRKLMNREEGYWIGSANDIGIDYGKSGEIKINGETSVLVYSDGLSEAFELFGIVKQEDDLFDPETLARIVRELREKQEEDSNRVITRVRKKDDLTYILGR